VTTLPTSVCPTRLTGAELIRRLERGGLAPPGLAAFDGDGTLWSGDVSDDVFEAACAHDFLLPTALPPLVEAAREAGLATAGTASELAARLFAAHQQGKVPELRMFELMTLCYAGHEEREVTDFSASVLGTEPLAARLRQPVVTLLRHLRERGILCLLVTASPRPIVTVPARLLGFAPETVVAATCRTSAANTLLPRLALPLPYGPEKPAQVRGLFPEHRWYLALGDSPFDLPMLLAAEHAVAIGERLVRSVEADEQARLIQLELGPAAC